MELSISQSLSTKIAGEELYLLPQKAIYWPSERSLLIADLHLGKGNHFRKNGIAIPASSHQSNWKKLNELFLINELKRVIFLGDLFHSSFNEDCRQFVDFINEYPHLKFELVAGNHDILDLSIYHSMGMKVYPEELKLGPFLLTHEPLEPDERYYNLAGHIHPGVKLRGGGRQSLRAACFHFGNNRGILPAFGSLTGLATIKVKKEDQVYLVIKDQVIKAQ